MKNNDKKNFIWNSIGSTFNAFTSLFFMIIVTRVNGVDKAGIFTFAFSLALLLQVIGNYFGRSYQVTNIDDNLSSNDFVYSRFITCTCMLLASIVYILFKSYNKEKIIVIMLLVLFRIIESFGEILYGIIQKDNRLYQVGISLFFKGVLSVVIFFITDYITKNLLLSILTISLINLIIMLIYDMRNVKNTGFKLNKINKDKVKKILKGGFFVFLFTFLIQYVTNASKYSIDSYMTNSYQTIYGIILMPATVMILFSQFLIQPFLNILTNYIKEKNINRINQLILKISGTLIIFGVISIIFCYFVGIPILNLVYGIKLNSYRNCLIIIILGAIFYGLSYIISNCLIAMRKNFGQAVIYILVSIITCIISNILVKEYKIFGASLSYLITMIILLIFYIIFYIICVKKYKGGDFNEVKK